MKDWKGSGGASSATTIAACFFGAALVATETRAATCDGTETICINLANASEVEGTGGQIVGGTFTGGGFRPSDRGGIDWDFGPGTDLSTGRVAFEVTGLLPTTGGDTGGGKRGLFDMEGVDGGVNHGLQLQKMAEDYRDGHIFRLGMDDDGLADNWDTVIITGSGFPCGVFSIADWGPNETHSFDITWRPGRLTMKIDSWECTSTGNSDGFDPAYKTFTLGNRVQHYPVQHADAIFRNFRFWVGEGGEPPPPPPPPPPGAIHINPAHDAKVARGEKGDPDTSYGFTTDLTVGADPASLPDEVTFFAFNTHQIEGNVTSAVLHLTAFDGGGAQSIYGTSEFLRDSVVRWNEQLLTWNTAPFPTTGVVDSIPGVQAGQSYAFDVTELVNPGERLALMLISSASNGGGFRSREHGVPAERPYLEVRSTPGLFAESFEDGTFGLWDEVYD